MCGQARNYNQFVRKKSTQCRTLIATLLISASTLLVAIRLLYHNSDGNFSSLNLLRERDKESRSNVLIIAHARTGSSWLGKLFDSHPSVFYMYEPLYVLHETTLRNPLLQNSALYTRVAVKLLQDIFDCDFMAQEEFIRFLSSLPHQRFSSKSLFNPFCSLFSSATQTPPRKYLCEDLTAQNVSRVCNNHAHIVVKTLSHRFPLNIRTLQILFKNIARLSVIHLVRDPRAVMNSIIRVGWISGYNKHATGTFSPNISSSLLKTNIKRFCTSMLKEIRFILEAEERFPGRYRLISYEKIVRNPLRESQKLYKFADIPFSSQSIDWVTLGENEHLQSIQNNPYSVLRPNASQLIDSWRTQLGKYETKILEKQCLPVMRLLGYRRVFGEKD